MAANKATPNEPPQAEAAPKTKRKIPRTAMIVAIVAVVEAGLLLGAMKLFGGGAQVAHGATAGDNALHGEDPTQKEKVSSVEVEMLTKFRVPNDKSGRMFIYDFDLAVKVSSKRKDEIDRLVAERRGELSDRVARIIRGNESAVLNEPDLKTLRMQIRNAIGELVGDPEVVQEVLIPRCVPMRTD